MRPGYSSLALCANALLLLLRGSNTLPAHLLDELGILRQLLEFVQWLEIGDLAAEDEAVEPPGQGLEDLVAHVSRSWDGEDVVQFF